MTQDRRLPDERVREILAAAQNATAGRRDYAHDEHRDDYVILREPNDTPVGRMESALDAEFAVEADPTTIAALASELLALREALALASNKFAFAAGLSDPVNKNMFLRGAKAFCDEALGATNVP